MTLLLRAIVAPEDAGIAEELGLSAVSGSLLAALASHWEKALVAGEPELLDHHRIIQSVFERVPCLPARFGSVFDDEDALRTRLNQRDVDLASQLARLGHRCELAITCAWRDKGVISPVSIMTAGSGRAYLERGLQQRRSDRERVVRAEAIVARLLGELATEPTLVRHRTCPRPAVAVSMSALVTRDEIDGLSSRLERLGAQLPDVTIVVQGPWAPYTFAVSE
ncbi:MAG TPA: GvpL/GvpF family gas vesicle protein [Candidatus Limnocylindria bacterium]